MRLFPRNFFMQVSTFPSNGISISSKLVALLRTVGYTKTRNKSYFFVFCSSPSLPGSDAPCVLGKENAEIFNYLQKMKKKGAFLG